MTGRHSLSTPGGQDRPAADNGPEGTVAAISGLRWRLRQRPEDLKHPAVLSELGKLEDLITGPGPSPRPGRHRSSNGTAVSDRISDADGLDHKPDPRTAATPAELITMLWRYRAWSGNPSWRKMAERAGQAYVHSTMYSAMRGSALPKLDVVEAIIVGCGGGDEDLQAYTTAWKRIAAGQIPGPAASGEYLSAPLPVLPLEPVP